MKYIIEIIQCVNVYYPTKHICTVKANSLCKALDKCFDNLTYGTDCPDSEDLDNAKETCESEWGFLDKDELLLLAYNNYLDNNNSEYRILCARTDDKEIATILETEEYEIK